MNTNHDRLINMTAEELASFLYQATETGTQYFTDQVCEQCRMEDCPQENGCCFSPLEMIRIWLQQ